MSEPLATPSRPLDPLAAARWRQQLAGVPEAPWLHAESARRMAERLPIFRQAPRRVIDWSGAAGGPPEVLERACPQARIERVAAPGRERAAAPWWRQLWATAAGRAPLSADAVPEAAFDLGWSVMALHWECDPPAVLRRWRQALVPEGALMFSTLGPGTLTELSALYRDAGWGSPMAPLVDMHDLGDMLVEAGFAGPVMDQELLTLTWASPEAALAELRSLGGNADPLRHAGCRTPRWRQRLLAALAERCQADGRVALRFELVHGHAIRGADSGPRVTPDTRISLGEMSAMLRRPAR